MDCAPASEIIFKCEQCQGALVVDATAAGTNVTCGLCAKVTRVPTTSTIAGASTRVIDLQRQLKENEAQRTEVTGCINQLCIQLHRWKLRLQILNERKTELEAQLSSLVP